MAGRWGRGAPCVEVRERGAVGERCAVGEERNLERHGGKGRGWERGWAARMD